MASQIFLRRKAASKYLHDVHGVVRAPSTLAKYAVVGGGPVFRRLGRDPVYTPVGLDEWVASLLSEPMRSTSEAAPQFISGKRGTTALSEDMSNSPDNDALSATEPQLNAKQPASLNRSA